MQATMLSSSAVAPLGDRRLRPHRRRRDESSEVEQRKLPTTDKENLHSPDSSSSATMRTQLSELLSTANSSLKRIRTLS